MKTFSRVKNNIFEVVSMDPQVSDFLDNLAKRYRIPGAGYESGRAGIIQYMNAHPTTFSAIRNFLSSRGILPEEPVGPTAVAPATESQTSARDNYIKLYCTVICRGITIIDPEMKSLENRSQNARTAAANTSHLYKFTPDDISLEIEWTAREVTSHVTHGSVDSIKQRLKLQEESSVNIDNILNSVSGELITKFTDILDDYYSKNLSQWSEYNATWRKEISARVTQFSQQSTEFRNLLESMRTFMSSVAAMVPDHVRDAPNVLSVGIAVTPSGTKIYNQKKSKAGVPASKSSEPNATPDKPDDTKSTVTPVPPAPTFSPEPTKPMTAGQIARDADKRHRKNYVKRK